MKLTDATLETGRARHDPGPRRGSVPMAAVALLCSACVPSSRLRTEEAPAPVFDPIVFFSGRTHGTGRLSIVLHRPQPTDVTGEGRVESDGSIVLDQVVKRGSGAPTRREWRLRRVGAGDYAGTLTDAAGPVRGTVRGNCLHLSFAMRGGLHADQWLYLQPGGAVAQNRMIVTKLGIAVASLDETITRVPS